jgi:predicted ATPase with chaperone activity
MANESAKVDDKYFENLLSRLNHALSESRRGETVREDVTSMDIAHGAGEISQAILDAVGEMRAEEAASVRQANDKPASRAGANTPAPDLEVSSSPAPGEFWPLAPADWDEMKLSPTAAEELSLKCLMNRGSASGREMSDQIAIPFGMLSALLNQMKANRLVVHRGSAQLGDYVYQLSESGMEAAARYSQQCAYDGAAPITLQDYVDSVSQQSIHRHPPTFTEISRVFQDLVLSEDVLDQVGQAIRAGYGFFLYGESGNGKTSLAERVSRAFGNTIWIPRSLTIEGTIIRLFDPCNHVEVPPENKDGLYDQLKIDRRWVRIRRPTILVGGELTMDRLEIRPGSAPGINEAPLQLKSNGGTLVIDDFGRQRMEPEELLNRWIVPLDRRYDFLNLSNGKTIQVPFDQLLIFSTNMQPHDLADEAFLRRIPYKIRAVDPTEAQFRELFRREAERVQIPYQESVIDDLIRTHYVAAGRPLRCCHARDLLRQIKHYCEFKQVPLEMTSERFATATRNYFAAMG